jgi:hypothetical protein
MRCRFASRPLWPMSVLSGCLLGRFRLAQWTLSPECSKRSVCLDVAQCSALMFARQERERGYRIGRHRSAGMPGVLGPVAACKCNFRFTLQADSGRTSHHVRSVPQPGSCTAVRFHNGMPLDECGTKPVIFHRNNRKAAIQVICLAAVLSLDPSSMLDRDNTRSVFRNSKLQWQQRPPRLRLPPLAVSFDVQRRRNSWGLTVVPHALVRYQRTMRDRLLVTSQLNRKPQT